MNLREITKHLFCGLAAAALLTACRADSDSGSIDSDEWWTVYTITGDSDTNAVTCAAALTVGGGQTNATTISLEATDTLSCGLNNSYQDLARTGQGHYGISGLALTEGAEYSMRLMRTGGCDKSGTFLSTVRMPEKMQLLSPTAGATFSMTAPLAVSWNPGDGSTVTISITSSTAEASGYAGTSVADTGSTTLTVEQLANLRAGTGTLTITRQLAGTAPTGVKGGSITAQTTQKIAITVTP